MSDDAAPEPDAAADAGSKADPGGSRPGPDPATRAAITAGRAPAIGRGAGAAR